MTFIERAGLIGVLPIAHYEISPLEKYWFSKAKLQIAETFSLYLPVLIGTEPEKQIDQE